MVDGLPLVTLKTRVPRAVADRLADAARLADRSVAAELRQAIDRHLTPPATVPAPVVRKRGGVAR